MTDATISICMRTSPDQWTVIESSTTDDTDTALADYAGNNAADFATHSPDADGLIYDHDGNAYCTITDDETLPNLIDAQ